MLIRPFVVEDYRAVTSLHNANYADYKKAAEEIRDRDENYPESCRWARWVAESDCTVVGFGEYHQNPGIYHPRKFSLEFAVDPGHYGQGIGTQLYRCVMEALEPFHPLSVDTWTREDMVRLIGFLERRGFACDTRGFTSVLDLERFAPEQWAHRVASLEAQGLQVRSLHELGVSDRVVREKVYDLWVEVRYDVPLPPGEERTPVSFEDYWRRVEGPSFYPAGFFVAIDEERYVGFTQLFLPSREGELRTGLTAVRRGYRRRGIASGLKVHALSFGKAQGYARVFTENAASNEGMLAINWELGFVKNPAWLHYVKTLSA